MKYFIYARKSTEDDDKQILSIQAQLAELQEYSAKEKLEIVKDAGQIRIHFFGGNSAAGVAKWVRTNSIIDRQFSEFGF